jgi:hypothetical protein
LTGNENLVSEQIPNVYWLKLVTIKLQILLIQAVFEMVELDKAAVSEGNAKSVL